MESPAATETAAPRDSELPSGPSPALPKKVVSFGGVEGAGTLAATGGGAAAAGSSSKQPPSAGGATASPLYTNELFSPGPQRQDSWTIEAHAGMEGAGSAAPSGPVSLGGASPLASTPGYTPASSGWLESARKVDDLRGRLESLEAALKEMESKAVAHLDKSLQEKVLATAAKIVQKRFLADKELDRKLQHQILQASTAIKVVKRQGAAHAAAAEAEANPTRRLEFEQQGMGAGGGGGVAGDAGLAQYVMHIEQGLGEVVRRLEKKVDAVASLLDQDALELLEARMAGGVVQLEARLAALEAGQQHQAPPAEPDTSRQLLDRVAAVEAAMAEQSRAVTDLLTALGSQAGASQVGAAVAAVQATQQAAAAGSKSVASAEEPAAEGKPEPGAGKAAEAEPAQRQSQLLQRKSAAVKRSVLGDPSRSGFAAAAAAGEATARPSPRSAMPRLKTTHAAGTAQQIAMATARQQLALQAARAREESEAETPAWLSMMHLFGWGLLVVMGLAAVLVGMVGGLVKAGRLSQDDLAFLFK